MRRLQSSFLSAFPVLKSFSTYSQQSQITTILNSISGGVVCQDLACLTWWAGVAASPASLTMHGRAWVVMELAGVSATVLAQAVRPAVRPLGARRAHRPRASALAMAAQTRLLRNDDCAAPGGCPAPAPTSHTAPWSPPDAPLHCVVAHLQPLGLASCTW